MSCANWMRECTCTNENDNHYVCKKSRHIYMIGTYVLIDQTCVYEQDIAQEAKRNGMVSGTGNRTLGSTVRA